MWRPICRHLARGRQATDPRERNAKSQIPLFSALVDKPADKGHGKYQPTYSHPKQYGPTNQHGPHTEQILCELIVHQIVLISGIHCPSDPASAARGCFKFCLKCQAAVPRWGSCSPPCKLVELGSFATHLLPVPPKSLPRSSCAREDLNLQSWLLSFV